MSLSQDHSISTKPKRLINPPIRFAKDEVNDKGQHLERLLKLDHSCVDNEVIANLKRARQEFVAAVDKLLPRLADVSTEEHSNFSVYKLTLQCEVFRTLNKLNERRKEDGLDLISNNTPDDVSLFSADEPVYTRVDTTPFKLGLSNYSSVTEFQPLPQPAFFTPSTRLPTSSKVSQMHVINSSHVNTQLHSIPHVPNPEALISGLSYPSNFPRSQVNSVFTSNQQNYRTFPSNSMVNNRPTAGSIDVTTNYLLKQQLLVKPVSPFSGKSENFNTWSSNLKSRMRDVVLTTHEQLQILSCNTTGVPHDIIQDYIDGAGSDLSEGIVDLIWTILSERYASPSHSFHYIEKRVQDFPVLKSSEQKEELGRLIDLCRLILLKIPHIPELNRYNYSEGMKNLWFKLPENLRLRWRSYGIKAKINSGNRNPTLSVFLSFLKEIYDEINDEFFEQIIEHKGKRSSKVLLTQAEVASEEKVEQVVPTNAVTHVNANSSEGFQMCPLHEKSKHCLADCKKFHKLSYTERKDLVWKNKLCFKCFGSHIARNCKEKVVCNQCGKRHNTLMHDDSFSPGTRFLPRATSDENCNEHSVSDNSKNLCTAICDNKLKQKCSKTLLACIRHKDNPTRILKGYIIIDEQSSDSFVDPTILQDLDILGVDHTYSLRTLSGLETGINGSIINNVQVKGIMENTWHEVSHLLSNPYIPDSRNEVATSDMVSEITHLRHLKHNFPRKKLDVPVLMLLGVDSGRLMHTECHGSQPPYAHKTPLGWALVGVTHGVSSPTSSSKVLRAQLDSSHKCLYAYPEFHKDKGILDVFREFKDDETLDFSQEDKTFLSIMQHQVKVTDGQLTMPLPFKSCNTRMPDNRAVVHHRTAAAVARIKRDPVVLEQCLKSFQINIDKRHVEPVPVHEEYPSNNGNIWFLPVFAVKHPKKNKSRLVFDASASYKGTSLNKKLLQGPHITNNLRSVLLRSRKGLIGISCDIEHMFYNFLLDESQKDFLRFYWFKNNNPENELTQFRARVHIFGATSSPAVASFGLHYVALHSSLTDAEDARRFIKRSFYVDDGVTSVNTIDEGIKLLNTTQKMLQEFKIRLHKFASSSSELLNHLPKEDIDKDTSHVNFDDSRSRRTLGVVWELSSDCYIARVDVPDAPFTRRGVLAVVNSFFDPIGMAAPVILSGKLFQRKVTSRNSSEDQGSMSWDSPLPRDYLPQWQSWKTSLVDASLLKLPRCFIPKDFDDVERRELHIFCDASFDAIGVVIYIKSFAANGQYHVSFVSASSRLTPKAACSIPRLELNAALQAAAAGTEVIQEIDLKLDDVRYYTDSRVVLGYLNNKCKVFKRYVSRRVDLILKVAPPSQWTYVSTHDNPADLASRPTDPQTLAESNWFSGPNFLLTPEHAQRVENYEQNDCELPEEVKLDKVSMSTKITADKKSGITHLCGRSSNFTLVVNVVKRILCLLMRKDLVSNDIAIRKLLFVAQRECFPEVFKLLLSDTHLPESHALCKLSPYIDDSGLIRVGGRLKRAVPFDHAHPIFVPANHPISELLLQHLHGKVGHQGRHITHGYVREQGYHFQNGRQVIRNLLSRCVICKRLRGQPVGQMMADLPPDRLETCPPFTNTGLDVFGPFPFHDGINTRRSSATKKMFVLLLTCLVTRAVHLEPLASMDTSSCINALRRFFAVRGSCKRLRSDHGSNFIGTINQTSQVDHTKLRELAETHSCEWILNPPKSSHFGGAIERKIGSVRRVMEETFLLSGNRVLSRDEIMTLLQEAAAIVNSTPMYEVSLDPNDGSPISPNTLLTLKDAAQPLPLEHFTEKDLLQYGARRWRRVQYLADQFWCRWRSQYLSTLTQRRKWLHPKRNFKIGDVVILRDKGVPRYRWPLAIIHDVKISSDGLVRSVTIKTKGKFYVRMVHDLVLLVSNDSE